MLPPTGVVGVRGVRTVLEVEPKLGVAGTRLHVGCRVATEPACVVVVGEMEGVPERTRRRSTWPLENGNETLLRRKKTTRTSCKTGLETSVKRGECW